MKKYIPIFVFLFSGAIALAQVSQGPRSYPPGYSAGKAHKKERVQAPDFTITDTDGNTLNLYQTLNEGKTVFLDFFFTTCSYCIQYAPIIEQVYQNYGAGQGDVVFWGLDYGDNNAQVIAYKQANNVSNPCASGTQGGGNQATALYQSAFNFLGWPTYTIICPDKTVNWDVNYPPNVNGFNSYFSSCGATGMADLPTLRSRVGITNIYPVPARSMVTLEVKVNTASKLKVEVYDILGIKVNSILYDVPSQGEYELEIPLNDLAGGNYFLKLYQDNEVRGVRKFSKLN